MRCEAEIRRGGDHSSGPPIARRLGAVYPRVAQERRNDPTIAGRAGPLLLFGLAPRGVYRAANIAVRAVGSYPAVSPLPGGAIWKDRPEVWPRADHRFASPAVCFLWHYPWPDAALAASDPLALPGALPCGVRTFLQAFPRGSAQRSPNPLAGSIIAQANAQKPSDSGRGGDRQGSDSSGQYFIRSYRTLLFYSFVGCSRLSS